MKPIGTCGALSANAILALNGGAIPVIKPFTHVPGKEEPPPDHEYRSDDCLWLFNAVPLYVAETGDTDFYNVIVPYSDKGKATVDGKSVHVSGVDKGTHVDAVTITIQEEVVPVPPAVVISGTVGAITGDAVARSGTETRADAR